MTILSLVLRCYTESPSVCFQPETTCRGTVIRFTVHVGVDHYSVRVGVCHRFAAQVWEINQYSGISITLANAPFSIDNSAEIGRDSEQLPPAVLLLSLSCRMCRDRPGHYRFAMFVRNNCLPVDDCFLYGTLLLAFQLTSVFPSYHSTKSY